MGEFGSNERQFAQSLGLKYTTLRSILDGGPQGPSLAKVYEIMGNLAPQKAWYLITGTEPPSQPSPPTLNIQNVPRFKRFADEFRAESYIPVRLLRDAASAGAPVEVDDHDVDSWALIYASREWMPNDAENYTCIRVRGKSMYPILDNGDIVAIDHAERDPHHLDGKMTAFRVNGGVTIKWCKFFEERVQVVGIPENRDEIDHAVSLSGEEIDDGIIGMVRWWWAKR